MVQSDEGESSDDEEDDDSPEGDADSSQGDDDDDEGSRSSGRDAGDWYDVDDGFIDDSEFLDAADVDERKPKHNGFFMNKVRFILRVFVDTCRGAQPCMA